MATDSLRELIYQLSPEEQAAVRAFVEFLRQRKTSAEGTPFLNAVEEFVAAHPALLRRLAQ